MNKYYHLAAAALALCACQKEAEPTKGLRQADITAPTSPCLALFGLEVPMCEWKAEGEMAARLTKRELGRTRVVNEARGLQPGVNKEFSQKREWTTTVEYEGNLPVAKAIELKYGYLRGTSYSEEETFNLSSRSCPNWNIVETEIWRSGVATQSYVNSKSGEKKRLNVPFRVLAYTSLTAVPVGCDVKPKVVADSPPPTTEEVK